MTACAEEASGGGKGGDAEAGAAQEGRASREGRRGRPRAGKTLAKCGGAWGPRGGTAGLTQVWSGAGAGGDTRRGQWPRRSLVTKAPRAVASGAVTPAGPHAAGSPPRAAAVAAVKAKRVPPGTRRPLRNISEAIGRGPAPGLACALRGHPCTPPPGHADPRARDNAQTRGGHSPHTRLMARIMSSYTARQKGTRRHRPAPFVRRRARTFADPGAGPRGRRSGTEHPRRGLSRLFP